MFEYANCAWAWTRQASQYMLWARAVCREFAACVNVWICWLCMSMDEASALVHPLWSSHVCHVSWVWNMFQCLIVLVVHGNGRGMRLGTCLVHTACVMAIVAFVTGDGLCRPKPLHANKQHAHAFWNNNFMLQIAINNHACLQTRYRTKSITFHIWIYSCVTITPTTYNLIFIYKRARTFQLTRFYTI